MKKNNSTRNLLFLFGFIIILFSLPLLKPLIQPKSAVSPTPPAKQQATQETTISYTGEEGKDALALLKAHATIEQSASGLVTAINSRKANDAKHEFWAFYVNGKMAQLGPAEYQTKTGDKIEWKIEKY